MSSKLGQIRPGTTELAALEHHKKSMLPLFLVSQFWSYLGNSQVSVYRTIGPLVLKERERDFILLRIVLNEFLLPLSALFYCVNFQITIFSIIRCSSQY